MAVTLTAAQLAAALRLGDSVEETAEAVRLLDYTRRAVFKHAPEASDAIHNEAAIRLAGYLFDQPNAGRGMSFAHAGRNSGAWAILLPYRIHRAGTTGEAVAFAQAAVGTAGNPVVDVTVSGSELVVTFQDATTEYYRIKAGIVLGPATNTFNAATRAEAERARDTFAAGNAGWLASYDADRTFAIVLSWPAIPAHGTYQVRASGVWLDISGLVIEVGGLTPGNDALDELRYRNGAWTPISPVGTTYGAWTRSNTFASLKQIFDDVANNPGGSGTASNGVLGINLKSHNFGASNLPGAWAITMDALWPVGDAAPYLWILAPQFYEWLPNFTVNFYTNRGNDTPQRMGGVSLVTQSFTVGVDGVPYDVAVIQCPLTRPPDTDSISVSFIYTPPVETSRVVTMM